MSKCKLRKTCKLYGEGDYTCDESGGMYFENETKPGSCYVEIMEKNE